MNDEKVPKKCHCCDNGNYKDYSYVDTYKCDQCGHIYRHFKEDVTKFHEGDDYRGHTHPICPDGQFSEDKKTFKELPPALKQERLIRCQKQLSIVKRFIKENESLIDLATGKGFFLEEAKKIYKNLKANDLHRTSVSHNAETNPEVEIILCDILSMDESTSYDGATGFDVLEHIDDVNRFVEKVYKILNKYLIIQVPCDREPFPPPNEGVFDGHVHYFSEQSLYSLFCKNNLFSLEGLKKAMPGELAGGPEIIAVFKKQ